MSLRPDPSLGPLASTPSSSRRSSPHPPLELSSSSLAGLPIRRAPPPPPSRSLSPPAAARSSPTSPVGSAPHNRRPVSMGGLHPAAPSPEDLGAFIELCRQFYYHADSEAGKTVDHTLRNTPAAHRAAFTKAQAGVRSHFHRDEEIRRRTELDELMERTVPGATVARVIGASQDHQPSVKAMRSPRCVF
jgi:hypothetical protein